MEEVGHGALVGTALKNSMAAERVVAQRVKQLMDEVRMIRADERYFYSKHPHANSLKSEEKLS